MKKLLLSGAVGIFIAQGFYMPALADPTQSCSDTPPLPANPKDEAKRYELLSDWLDCKELSYKDLVDLAEPSGSGLNIEKVKERQKLIRTNNSINMKTNGRSEVTSDILNLSRTLHYLPRAIAIQNELKGLKDQLTDVEKNLKEKKKKWFKSTSEKKLIKELSDLREKFTSKIKELEEKKTNFRPSGYLDRDRVEDTIKGQEAKILMDLGQYGLTKDHLDKLPTYIAGLS